MLAEGLGEVAGGDELPLATQLDEKFLDLVEAVGVTLGFAGSAQR